LIAWLPALAGEASGVLINNTPIPKEREMADENRVEWTKLLEQAISEPGKINEAYRRFHGYSLGNRLWAMCQCVTRGIEPSPLASFNRWKELGRHVKKGERALSLCMPLTRKRSQADRDGNEIEITYQFFVVKKNWFVLSQTEGAEYTPDPIPNWDEQRALSILNISKVPFDLLNGNVQGYAAPDRKISVSPLATQPFKTLFHELRISYWVMSNQQARSQTRMRHHAACKRSRLNRLPCCAARRSSYREWSIPEITSSRGPKANQLVSNQPIASLRQRTKS
jgi:hypothetical protein